MKTAAVLISFCAFLSSNFCVAGPLEDLASARRRLRTLWEEKRQVLDQRSRIADCRTDLTWYTREEVRIFDEQSRIRASIHDLESGLNESQTVANLNAHLKELDEELAYRRAAFNVPTPYTSHSQEKFAISMYFEALADRIRFLEESKGKVIARLNEGGVGR